MALYRHFWYQKARNRKSKVKGRGRGRIFNLTLNYLKTMRVDNLIIDSIDK